MWLRTLGKGTAKFPEKHVWGGCGQSRPTLRLGDSSSESVLKKDTKDTKKVALRAAADKERQGKIKHQNPRDREHWAIFTWVGEGVSGS